MHDKKPDECSDAKDGPSFPFTGVGFDDVVSRLIDADPVGIDDLISAVDRNARRIDRTISIGLGLIAGAIMALGIKAGR